MSHIPTADFEEVLVKDLNRANNEKRFAKDKKFWDDQLDAWGEPLYSDIQGSDVLEASRKLHRNQTLRAADRKSVSAEITVLHGNIIVRLPPEVHSSWVDRLEMKFSIVISSCP